MDYHSDRFEDASLLIYKKNKLIALLPANVFDNNLYSHQGLSYGGFVTAPKISFEDYTHCVSATLQFLEKQTYTTLFIKELPSIYFKLLDENWHYIASIIEAETIATDSYFVISDLKTYQPNRNRKRAITKANSHGILLTTDGIEVFWEQILSPNLNTKYGVKPVHSISEIKLLMERFPKQIHFYGATFNNKITAGVVIFETEQVAHFQYSSGDENKAETGALDFLFDAVIKKYQHKKYVSFGSSATDKTLKINSGLMYWKASFGAQLIPQKTYAIKTLCHKKLNTIFK